ncbi:MAG TPA: TAXI family TRAP transporter solute-binding subunit [Bacillota bacterium]|nr:TAXI family TRAP transporter solute-binding subunit [Bacillota bacterium]HOH09824.1 TAXI family TRAP transporter solute-binding subunit [Bacillota bacterium]HOS50330.1 TAXI family TRAP transporter solute-binding subunit [Bacillota bacterium]HOY89192.1 TAXI family TRAP transporter solute-binding subunit [Bacillota bacterium]HPI00763.1 TAXI family TRAP transporter solute-binding subunit [Bacillota bacterium]
MKLFKVLSVLLIIGVLSTVGYTKTVVRFTTGPLGAYNQTLYNGVADLLNKAYPGVYSFAVENSTGSTENARALVLGNADFGPAGNDVTIAAYNATGDFAGLPAKKINFVFCHGGMGAALHIAVPKNSSIKTVADLKGKKVGVGTGVMTDYFLQGIAPYGLAEADMKIVKLSLADLCNGLSDGTLDAISYGTPAPATNFTDLAVTKGFRLLDIGEAAVAKILEKYPYKHMVKIPANTYPGVDYVVTTFAQWTVLCCNADVPEEIVYRLVKVVMENNAALKAIHPNAADITLERSVDGAKIPIHPGALRYYKEVGRVK